MKNRNFVTVALGAFLVGLIMAGCGGEDSQKRASDQKSTGSSGKETDTDTKSDKASSGGIAFRALDFIPYILGSEVFSGNSSLLVEAGYFDIRQYNASGSAGGIKDYRGATVAAWGGAKVSAVTTGSGCSALQEFDAGGANSVSAADGSGFYEGALKSADSVLAASGLADSGAYEMSAALALDLTIDGKSRKISDKKIPPKGAISLSKAMYTIFGTHLDLSDMNTSLANSKRELVFTEDSETQGFDTVIATIYGSGGKVIRCLFGPGGSATLTKEQYSPLLPFRAVTVAFGTVELVTADGISTWTATFGGTGIEGTVTNK